MKGSCRLGVLQSEGKHHMHNQGQQRLTCVSVLFCFPGRKDRGHLRKVPLSPCVCCVGIITKREKTRKSDRPSASCTGLSSHADSSWMGILRAKIKVPCCAGIDAKALAHADAMKNWQKCNAKTKASWTREWPHSGQPRGCGPTAS